MRTPSGTLAKGIRNALNNKRTANRLTLDGLSLKRGGKSMPIPNDPVYSDLIDSYSSIDTNTNNKIFEDEIMPFDAADKELKFPILRSFIPTKSLGFQDFQALNPNVPIKYIIKGRFPYNLYPANQYYLIFNNMEDLNKFHGSYLQSNFFLNGHAVNFKPIPRKSFTYHLRYCISKDLPLFKDSKELVDMGMQEAKHSAHFKESMKKFMNSWSKNGPDMFLRKISRLQQRQGSAQTIDDYLLDRSHCVVLKNIPMNIHAEKINDFLWDLVWYRHHQNVIPVVTDPSTHFTTYLLLFDTRESATTAINRFNGNHLFFNSALPIVEAESL